MKVLLYTGGMRLVGNSGIGRALEHQAAALAAAGIPYTFDPKEDYDILQLNTVLPDSLWMSRRAVKKGKRVVYYGHSTMEDFRNSFPGSNRAAGLFRRWICCCYGSGDVIVTPTEYSRRLLESYPVVPPVRVLSNGINPEESRRDPEGGRRFRERYCFFSSDKVVLGVGHYMERKGILDFIRMAERFPAYEFVWFGHTPAPLVTGKVKKAMGRKLPNLQFPGFVSRRELMDAYSGSDLFFFPTREETEGIVMLEAMAMEIPVLVRDIPVYEDWLESGRDVYKAGSWEEMADLLEGILEGKLPVLTGRARETVRKKGIDTVGCTLAGLYAGLAEGR